MKIGSLDFVNYMKRLGNAAGVEINSFRTLKEALKLRLAFFEEMGCRASDHSLDYAMYVPASEEEVEQIFAKAINGEHFLRGRTEI